MGKHDNFNPFDLKLLNSSSNQGVLFIRIDNVTRTFDTYPIIPTVSSGQYILAATEPKDGSIFSRSRASIFVSVLTDVTTTSARVTTLPTSQSSPTLPHGPESGTPKSGNDTTPKQTSTMMIAFGAVGGALIVFIVICIMIFIRQRRRRKALAITPTPFDTRLGDVPPLPPAKPLSLPIVQPSAPFIVEFPVYMPQGYINPSLQQIQLTNSPPPNYTRSLKPL
ncbi:hypothetical protein ONZ45_g6837 [Pleurotus djamor]|nr:hypothetical protein ONZ45_g6837 [Pleurotus djamor]